MMKTKRFLAILLTATLLLGVLAVLGVVTAQAAAVTLVPQYGPNSTFLASINQPAAESVAISTREELENIGSGKYHLNNDIDLDGSIWTPKAFSGTLDGQGYVIKNLTITGAGGGTNYNGLFTEMRGTVKNVGLEDVSIDVSLTLARPETGGICGTNNGTISNCYITGAISLANDFSTSGSWTKTGGIAGSNDGTISYCYNAGAVFCSTTGTYNYVGGIAGSSGSAISYCYNAGAVFGSTAGSFNFIGGIVGENGSSDSSVRYCYNTGALSGTNSSSGSNINLVGGIFGSNFGEISYCHNAGRITYTNTTTNTAQVNLSNYVGGIGGTNYGSINDCYNRGALSLSSVYPVSNTDFIGGILAKNYSEIVRNCYNTGTLSVSTAAEKASIGGICASYTRNANKAAISNCYWNIESSQTVNGVPLQNGAKKGVNDSEDTTTALYAAQMKQRSSFAGFDFKGVWAMPKSGDYLYPVFGQDEPNPVPEDELLTLGQYPQSKVTDAALIAQLENAPFMIWTQQETPVTSDTKEVDGKLYALKDGDYYRYDPVQWRVLERGEGFVCLIADKVLGASMFAKSLFDESEGIYTWFQNEVGLRVTNTMWGELDPAYLLDNMEGTPLGLPSTEDAKKLSDVNRIAKPTDFAVAAGAYNSNNASRWWLFNGADLSLLTRRPAVDYNGVINGFNPALNDVKMGVRPTLKVDPAIFDVPEPEPEDDLLTLGQYPQSKVINPALIAKLENAPFMIWTQQEKPVTSDTKEVDGKLYALKDGAYYRYDPVQWRVLERGKGFVYLIADKVVGASMFAKSLFDTSEGIYTWFQNEVGLRVTNTMWGELDPAYLLDNMEGTPLGLPTTEDAKKLSDVNRIAKPTDFAVAAGAYNSDNASRWWLYNGADLSLLTRRPAVDYNGVINGFNPAINDVKMGVRPTLKVDPAIFEEVIEPPARTVTATFIDYEGTAKITRTVPVSISGDDTAGIAAPPVQNTYSGWEARGWTTSTAADAAPAENFSIGEDTTFYGLYGRELTLSYETDGGNPKPQPQKGDRRANSFNIAVPANPTFQLASAVILPGYDFDGWIVNTTGASYAAGANITISKDTTVLARWKAKAFTVTYDRTENGGAGPNTTAVVYEGFAIDLTPVAAKPNWEFAGWNTDKNAGAGLNSLTMGGADVTLYAIFKPISVKGVSLIITSWKYIVPDAYDHIQLGAVIAPQNAANQAVAWRSSNAVVAMVDSTGFIKTLKPGAADVTVKTDDGGHEAVCEITVKEDGTDISLNKEELQMKANASIQLQAETLRESVPAREVESGDGNVSAAMASAPSQQTIWSSSDPSVATVDENGFVQTHSAGEAIITATLSIDAHNSVSTKYVITVGKGAEKPVDGNTGNDTGNSITDNNPSGNSNPNAGNDNGTSQGEENNTETGKQENGSENQGNADENQSETTLKWWQELASWLQWLLRIFAFGWIWM